MFDGKAFGEAVVAQVKTYVDRALEGVLTRIKAVEDRSVPADGKDGAPGRDGLPGVPGRDGTNGRDGKDGAPGERGFGLDDFSAEVKDDGRTILLKFNRGETVEVHELHFPVMLYRGVLKEGQTYERGDTVTFGGSLWHCDETTTEKPGDGANSWTLAAKRGRDGKDGKGEKGDPGPAGRDGRDLTQIGPDGARW